MCTNACKHDFFTSFCVVMYIDLFLLFAEGSFSIATGVVSFGDYLRLSVCLIRNHNFLNLCTVGRCWRRVSGLQ